MNLLIKTKKEKPFVSGFSLGESEAAGVLYHDLFDYPLTSLELIRWSAGAKVKLARKQVAIASKNGFFFLKERQNLVYKRLMRERFAKRKLKIARKAARWLALIPTIKLVAVTGALAMKNTDEEADIDLMVVTQKGALWITRLLALLWLDLLRLPRRRYQDKNQKDKLCLNIWLDETNLVWPKKNIFTAHEIAQVIPLVNKEKTYEKFLYQNRWLKKYWPNATSIRRHSWPETKPLSWLTVLEPLARKYQYWYMKGKISHEEVAFDRALFHPVDWSEIIQKRLKGQLA